MSTRHFHHGLRLATAAIWIGALAAASPAVNFNSPQEYPVGLAPAAICVADFNGDGKADMAIASLYENNGAILLGNGDGSFQPVAGSGLGGTAIAAGDFNGDGKPDLALISGTSLIIELGNGDGTFRNGSTVPIRQTYAVIVGDFNGDGKLDIALAQRGVGILLGNGDGNFQPLQSYPTGGNGVNGFTAGDFNGDGKLDLAAVSYASGNVSIILGQGDGTFGPPKSYAVNSHPESVAAADFNGDGKLDLAVANYSSGNVSVLLGNGDGSFQPQTTFPSAYSATGITVGDFNGDGKPDLAVASTSVVILLGKGDGTFTPPKPYAGGNGTLAIAAADFNGDGRLDIGTAVYLGERISGFAMALLGDGHGGFPKPLTYPLQNSPDSVVVADFNGDGKPDVAAANSKSHNISILKGNGDGSFQPQMVFPAPGSPLCVAVGDFNGDGKPDLAVTLTGRDAVPLIAVLLGNDDGSFGAPIVTPLPYPEVYVVAADFNGDGKLDLALAGAAVQILLGNGDGTFQPAAVYGGAIDSLSEAVADFNGDGTPDLVVVGFYGGVTVYLGNPDGTLQSPQQLPINGYFVSVTTGDLKRDGKQDFVLVSQTCLDCGYGNVFVLFGNGDGTFNPPVLYECGGAYPISVAIADINGDGKPDLVVANAVLELGNGEQNDVAVLLGNGEGIFQTPVAFLVGKDPKSMALGDFNLDGKPDVAVVFGGGLNVLTNTTP